MSLCFDSDAATNPNVRRAECHLAEALARKGAVVNVARLPQGNPGPDGTPHKAGLDDYLVAHGPDALRELLAAAVAPTPPEKGLTPNEAADDPHRLARLYIANRCQHADGLTLRSWRDQWHRWNNSAYRELPDAELQGELTASAKREMGRINIIAQKLAEGEGPPPEVQKITKGMIGNVEMALASMTVWCSICWKSRLTP